jgi:uncharacterized protein (TIGR02466 family)|tara:strand:+ start:1535 stop:2137 length:603 start_codon:yes stop_codon:yes gene_type:complete
MKTLELFPTLIDIDVLDNIPDDYIKQCKNIILDEKRLGYASDSVTSDQYILDRFPPLKDVITKYINQYVAKLSHTLVNYKISSSWGYVTRFNNAKENLHHHNNSNISGVFYLTKGASIAFSNNFLNDKFPFKTGLTFKTLDNRPNGVIELEIKEKQLIIFPSYLPHCVLENKDDSYRVSIAFNSIPSGEFGDITSKLNIK